MVAAELEHSVAISLGSKGRLANLGCSSAKGKTVVPEPSSYTSSVRRRSLRASLGFTSTGQGRDWTIGSLSRISVLESRMTPGRGGGMRGSKQADTQKVCFGLASCRASTTCTASDRSAAVRALGSRGHANRREAPPKTGGASTRWQVANEASEEPARREVAAKAPVLSGVERARRPADPARRLTPSKACLRRPQQPSLRRAARPESSSGRREHRRRRSRRQCPEPGRRPALA